MHNHLTQQVDEPIHILCVDGHQNNTLELLLTSHSDKYEVKVLSPLGNSSTSTGIKTMLFVLARPLAKLCCLSYRAGIFPSFRKFDNVAPILKKGETNNPENYRPIAVCSTLSKEHD